MFDRLIFIASIIPVVLSLIPSAVAEDLNCMLCHKYFGLSGFNDNGTFQIYYINEALNARSPHGRVDCVECHVGIDEVPHKNTKPVDCSIECHVDEPSRKKPFSHESVSKLLKKSAHSPSKKNGDAKKYKKDYPTCRDCHEQPLYRTLDGVSKNHQSLFKRGISRCKGCHDKDNFSEKYLLHVASRLQRQTNPLERIEICANCHGEKRMIARHKMSDVVSSYKETFHYKLLKLGSEKTPDCIECHVTSGANGHLIPSVTELHSPTHPNNVGKTCQQVDCHEKASKNLAGFQTHVTYERNKYPMQYYLLMFFRVTMTVVLYGFMIVVFLELLRRLYPPIVSKSRSIYKGK